MYTRLAFISLQYVTMASAARLIGLQFIFGGDEDEYGCKGSAGYSWCNKTDSCIPANEICSVLTIEGISDY